MPYVGRRHPGAQGVKGLAGGANCQQYAYEFLRHHGLDPRPLRSSELLEDIDCSIPVTDPEPLDLLLFNDTDSGWGAHVAVYLGDNKALHLSLDEGTPAIWALEDFAALEKYRVLVGIKRITRSTSGASPRTAMTPPRLQGRRIRLRPVTREDRDRLVEIRATNEVRGWWRGDDLSAEFHEDLDRLSVPQFAIMDEHDQVIGMIQYSEETDPDYRHASIDLYVDPSVHRRGYGTDAIITLADHLFDERGHHRLTIDPSANNLAAIACYTRVGFRPIGVMRRYERNADGTWSDGLLLDMLSSDRSPK